MQRTDGQRGTLRNGVALFTKGAVTSLAEVTVASLAATIAEDAITSLAEVTVASLTASIAADAVASLV